VDKKLLIDFCLSKSIELSEHQLQAFEQFENALYEANQVMNLTRITQEECTLKHFVDSLLIVDQFPQSASVLDLGTGAGLPAWPIACVRPDLQVTAIESAGKKCNFLNSQPLPNLTVIQLRVEDFKEREQFDVVTGRAFAPLPIQMELSAAFCKMGGLVIPFRTSNDLKEIESSSFKMLGMNLENVLNIELPATDVVRVFPVYKKVSKTQLKYPRVWSAIKQKPLNS
jgi:16S rRNA (guanine527-N7)-methyltransferase